ncbi:major facilitator superfamily domain-containing protein [Pelagophyceae sp. CCMP2097]|nr:major facilitator superfamily domain-containing protein [Pelagophyceae sp. CCMP2097]
MPLCCRASRRRLTLAVLTLVNISNIWHRNLLYALASVAPPQCAAVCDGAAFIPLCESCGGATACEACQACRASDTAEFYSLRDAACLDDSRYGVLASFAFTCVFAASGLIAGHVADGGDTRNVHAAAALAWALASFARVVSPDFHVLVAARIVLGVAEGFNAPCAYPVIAYHFAQDDAAANGAFSVGSYAGSALAALSMGLAAAVGWRATTTAAVLFGVFAATMLYHAVERPPRRTDAPEGLARAVAAAWRAVRLQRRVCLLYAATSLRMAATVALASYLPTYFARAFPAEEFAFSVAYAAGLLTCGTLSCVGGGALADRWASKRAGAHAWLPAAGTLASLPFLCAALYAETFSRAALSLLAAIVLGECWLGPCMSLLVRDSPPKMLATQVALLFACNQVAASPGPWLISRLDDGNTSVRGPLLAFVFTTTAAAGVGFAVLGRMHDREDAEAARGARGSTCPDGLDASRHAAPASSETAALLGPPPSAVR